MTQSFVPGIAFNESAASGRTDTNPGAWRTGLENTLHSLTTIQPCVTSKAVIDAIGATGKTVTIVPADQTRFSAGKLTPNAATDAANRLAATAKGMPVEDSSDVGTGGGSNSTVKFTPQDWDPPSSDSLDIADEVLLHELVHALRQARGLEDNTLLLAPLATMRRGEGSMSGQMLGTTGQPTKLSQIYHSIEDFCAILITNIYRSENNRPGLVRDHYAKGPKELGYPLTNARNFLSVWRPQIDRLQREMPGVCGQIAAVPCHFNPIRETRL